MADKILHTIWLALILITALILILFGHAYIPAETVYVGMISGLSGIVGARLAANGYNHKPPGGGSNAG